MEFPVTCALCNSLVSNVGNFFPNTEEGKKNHARIHYFQSKFLDEGITEDEVFRECFTIRNLKVERQALSTLECQQSLMDLCKSLLTGRSRYASVACNICGVGTSAKDKKTKMLFHAYGHLEAKLLKCRHCDKTASRVSVILHHIRRVHKLSKATKEDFEDRTVQCFDEVSDQIKRCFSTSYSRASGLQRQFVITGNCRGKSRRAIVNLCRSIFVQRSKPSRIECNLCQSRINSRGDYFELATMPNHAAAHLEVKLFACRHCNRSVSTKSSMRTHLRLSHHIIDGSSDDFVDQSDKYHTEYLNMIERCFSANQVKLETSSSFNKDKSTLKSEACIRNRKIRSKLTIERHLFCHRLIRKFSDADGKLKCLLCSKRLVVKFSGMPSSQVAFSHVEVHLQKPLYHCKVCGVRVTTHSNTTLHLKTKHALGMVKNHDYVGDEFHNEIMAMMSKCYDAEGAESL